MAEGGHVQFVVDVGAGRAYVASAALERIQLEEDSGKCIHDTDNDRWGVAGSSGYCVAALGIMQLLLVLCSCSRYYAAVLGIMQLLCVICCCSV